jgi:hypothetical protein
LPEVRNGNKPEKLNEEWMVEMFWIEEKERERKAMNWKRRMNRIEYKRRMKMGEGRRNGVKDKY